MSQAEIRIADARAAASAFGALSRLSGLTKLPSDQTEFSTRLSRVTGRGQPLAAALLTYVEAHGFDAFHSAFVSGRGATTQAAPARSVEAEAAATVSTIDFEALDRSARIFAASGLY